MPRKGKHTLTEREFTIVSKVRVFLEKLRLELIDFCKDHTLKPQLLPPSLNYVVNVTSLACGVGKNSVIKATSNSENNKENPISKLQPNKNKLGRKPIESDDSVFGLIFGARVDQEQLTDLRNARQLFGSIKPDPHRFWT